MAEASVKLQSTEQDVWKNIPIRDTSLKVCPVCHATVVVGAIEDHDKWHDDLAEFLKVLAGG